MDGEKRKAWEELVRQAGIDIGFYPTQRSDSETHAILAADAELTSLRARAEKAEEALCRAREAIQSKVFTCGYCHGTGIGWEGGTCAVCKPLLAVIKESAP